MNALLERHGTPFSQDVRIDLTKNTPSTFWSWYLTCLLLSARISSDLAVRAARAYLRTIGRSVRATEQATWEDRVEVLNANGYARYDERTSSMLGDTAAAVRERYGGDLRRLRAEAAGDSSRIHRLLQQFKGVGRVGADIFSREAQVAWDELEAVFVRRDRRRPVSAAGATDAQRTARTGQAGRPHRPFVDVTPTARRRTACP